MGNQNINLVNKELVTTDWQQIKLSWKKLMKVDMFGGKVIFQKKNF